MDEQPVPVEAMNLHPVLAQNLANMNAETPCSSGFHSVSSSSNSPVQNGQNGQNGTKIDEDTKEKQTILNSIVQVIEKENVKVLERLTSLQASRNKIESDVVKKAEANTESLTQPIGKCCEFATLRFSEGRPHHTTPFGF